jgi:hypothetical protein
MKWCVLFLLTRPNLIYHNHGRASRSNDPSSPTETPNLLSFSSRPWPLEQSSKHLRSSLGGPPSHWQALSSLECIMSFREFYWVCTASFQSILARKEDLWDGAWVLILASIGAKNMTGSGGTLEGGVTNSPYCAGIILASMVWLGWAWFTRVVYSMSRYLLACHLLISFHRHPRICYGQSSLRGAFYLMCIQLLQSDNA